MLCYEEKPAFYVLGVYGTPWVLDGVKTLQAAQRAINWQGGDSSEWVIAIRTGSDTFKEHNGSRTFTVERGPYKIEVFEAFKAEWEH